MLISQPEVLDTSSKRELRQVCQEASAAAEAAGQAVMASFAFEHGAEDLLPYAEGARGDEGFRVYWERPSEDFAFVAGGVAQRYCAGGRERFREIAGKVEPALRAAVSGGCGGDGPYVLGGFSFFDEIDEAEWPGFKPAQMVLPGWMMLRRGGTVTAMVNRMIRPGEKVEYLVAEMAEKVQRLTRLPTASLWENRLAPIEGLNRLFKMLNSEEGRRHWLDMVTRAVADIRAGKLSKVVLARTLDLLFQKAYSPLPILKSLRKNYPECINFIFNPGKGQTFLGATPEQLVQFDQDAVRLGALAGTMPRGETPEADQALARRLMDSNKERSEHQVVVDSIVDCVDGLGEVQQPVEPSIVKLNNLQHLYTPIRLSARQPVSILSMIERLHPTPAVGGHPHPVALERIRRFENFERGWYAGPLGWMNARGEGEFAVALRSCTLNDQRMRLFAGGGIVADSDPEQEYQETQLKLRPILAAIAHE